MKLDRALQLEMLKEISDCYPYECTTALQDEDEDRPHKIANLLYLQEHGLIDAGLQKYADNSYGFYGATATHKGLDFLEQDGGLTAMFGTVTIKFHDDTLRALIAEKISLTPGSDADKNSLLQTLKSLPSEGIKHLTMRLLEQGLDKMPDLLQQASRYLSL